MKNEIDQAQIKQDNHEANQVKFEIIHPNHKLLNEALGKRKLPHDILDTIVGGVDDNITSDSTKLLDGTAQIDASGIDDTTSDSSIDETNEVIGLDSFSAELTDGDLAHDSVDSESTEAASQAFDEPLVFGEGSNEVTVTQNSISGTTNVSWGDGNVIHLDSINSTINSDGSFTLIDNSRIDDSRTIDVNLSVTQSGVIEVTSDDSQSVQLIHIDPNGGSYKEVGDQHFSLDTLLRHPNVTFTSTSEGLVNIKIPDTFGDNDSIDGATIELMSSSNGLEISYGLNRLLVPNNVSIFDESSIGGGDEIFFTTDNYQIRLINGSVLDYGTFGGGTSLLSKPGSDIQVLSGRDGQITTTFFPSDARFASFEDGTLIISDGDNAQVMDPQGNLSNSTFGGLEAQTHLISLSDPSSPLEKTIGLVPNDGNGTDQTVVIDSRFTPEVVGDSIFFNSPDQVIHVDENGNIQRTWLDAQNGGAGDDDSVHTQLTITATGQASLQSTDLDDTIQLGDATIKTLDNGTTVLNISNEQGDFQVLIHTDGSVEIQSELDNHVFGDPDSNNEITLSYGLDGQPRVSWGEGNQLDFSRFTSEESNDGSLFLSNGTITYHLTTSGEIEVDNVHIVANGESYKEAIDQDKNTTRIPLDSILQDPNARYIITSTGSLAIEVTDGSTDNVFTIELTARPDALILERGLNTFYVPNDAISSYDKTNGSITFTSDSQTLRIHEDGQFNLTFNETGLSFLSQEVAGIGDALKWITNDGRDGQTFDAKIASFDDGTVLLTSRSGVAIIADSKGHLSNLIFGDDDSSTWLVNLSDDQVNTSGSAQDRVLALAPQNGTGNAAIIDSQFTPRVDNSGQLAFVREDEVISVDEAGNIHHAWGVTDVNQWIDAVNAGANTDGLARTEMIATPAGYTSFQSTDLDKTITTLASNASQSTDLEKTIKYGNTVFTTRDDSITALEITNDTGDNQILIHPDGSVEIFNKFDNQIVGDIAVTYGLNGQVTWSWGENNQFNFSEDFSRSEMEDDGSLILSDGAMTAHLAANGIIDMTFGEGQGVHIDPHGISYESILDRNDNIVHTELSADAVYTMTSDGALSIVSTGADGEEIKTSLQSAINDTGTLISTTYETITAHDAILTTGEIVINDPESGRFALPSGQITFANTPAAFTLSGDSWTDGHGVAIPANAVAHITDGGHIEFTYQDSDDNIIKYEFDTNGDLDSIHWSNDPSGPQLTKTSDGRYSFNNSSENYQLVLPAVDPLTSLREEGFPRSTNQLISSDGTIYLFQDIEDGEIQQVTIDTTGQLTHVNEIPHRDTSDQDLPDWAQEQLYIENVLTPLAKAILTYGEDNLPYWAAQDLKESFFYTNNLKQQEMTLLAEQGVDALNHPSDLPFEYGAQFSKFSDDEKAQILNLASQIDEQNVKQATVNEKLTDHRNVMQKTHNDLLNQITPQQLDELTSSIINETMQPDWAEAVLPQLDTVELNRLFATMQSRLSNSADAANDLGSEKLDDALNALTSAQINKINQIAKEILDAHEDDYSDWVNQELSNSQSEFAALDAVQQSQLNDAIADLAQAQHTEVLERAREAILNSGTSLSDDLKERDAALAKYKDGLNSQQSTEFDQYIHEMLADRLSGFSSDLLSDDPALMSRYDDLYAISLRVPVLIDTTGDIPQPPKTSFFGEMLEAFNIVGAHLLLPGLSEIPGAVGKFFSDIGEGITSGITGLGEAAYFGVDSVVHDFDKSLGFKSLEGLKAADQGLLGGLGEDTINSVAAISETYWAILNGDPNKAVKTLKDNANNFENLSIDIAIILATEGLGVALKAGAKRLMPMFDAINEELIGSGSAKSELLPDKAVQAAAVEKQALGSTAADNIELLHTREDSSLQWFQRDEVTPKGSGNHDDIGFDEKENDIGFDTKEFNLTENDQAILLSTESNDIDQTISERIAAVKDEILSPEALVSGTLDELIADDANTEAVQQQLQAYLDDDIINGNTITNAFASGSFSSNILSDNEWLQGIVIEHLGDIPAVNLNELFIKNALPIKTFLNKADETALFQWLRIHGNEVPELINNLIDNGLFNHLTPDILSDNEWLQGIVIEHLGDIPAVNFNETALFQWLTLDGNEVPERFNDLINNGLFNHLTPDHISFLIQRLPEDIPFKNLIDNGLFKHLTSEQTLSLFQTDSFQKHLAGEHLSLEYLIDNGLLDHLAYQDILTLRVARLLPLGDVPPDKLITSLVGRPHLLNQFIDDGTISYLNIKETFVERTSDIIAQLFKDRLPTLAGRDYLFSAELRSQLIIVLGYSASDIDKMIADLFSSALKNEEISWENITSNHDLNLDLQWYTIKSFQIDVNTLVTMYNEDKFNNDIFIKGLRENNFDNSAMQVLVDNRVFETRIREGNVGDFVYQGVYEGFQDDLGIWLQADHDSFETVEMFFNNQLINGEDIINYIKGGMIKAPETILEIFQNIELNTSSDQLKVFNEALYGSELIKSENFELDEKEEEIFQSTRSDNLNDEINNKINAVNSGEVSKEALFKETARKYAGRILTDEELLAENKEWRRYKDNDVVPQIKGAFLEELEQDINADEISVIRDFAEFDQNTLIIEDLIKNSNLSPEVQALIVENGALLSDDMVRYLVKSGNLADKAFEVAYQKGIIDDAFIKTGILDGRISANTILTLNDSKVISDEDIRRLFENVDDINILQIYLNSDGWGGDLILKFNELEIISDDEIRQAFENNVIDIEQEVENNRILSDDFILKLNELGIISDNDIRQTYSQLDLQPELLSENMTEGFILKLYELNVIPDDTIRQLFEGGNLSPEASEAFYESGVISNTDVYDRMEKIILQVRIDEIGGINQVDENSIIDQLTLFDNIITQTNYIKLLNNSELNITLSDIPQASRNSVRNLIIGIGAAGGIVGLAVLGGTAIGIAAGVSDVFSNNNTETGTADESEIVDSEAELTSEDLENIQTVNLFIDDNQDTIQTKVEDLQDMSNEEFNDFKSSLDPILSQPDLDFDTFMDLSLDNQINYVALTTMEVDNQLESLVDSSVTLPDITDDIKETIEQMMASDKDFALDVAQRESFYLAIGNLSISNTITDDPQQLEHQMIAAVSQKLSSLTSVDDFNNALSIEDQAAIAAAILAWDVHADANVQVQDPNDFATVVDMGNWLTDQTVLDKEVSVLNSDEATIEADLNLAANRLASLANVRFFLDADENSFTQLEWEQTVAYILAEGTLEGLDSDSLFAQENSEFNGIT